MNKKIIIVEGPRYTYKTSYIKKLKKQYSGSKMIHENKNTSYEKNDVIERFKKYQFFDRSVIGELVWSNLLGRKPKISDLEVFDIFKLLINEGYEFKIIIKLSPLRYKLNPIFKFFNYPPIEKTIEEYKRILHFFKILLFKNDENNFDFTYYIDESGYFENKFKNNL